MLKLRLDELAVDSFDTVSTASAKGTVFGEQCTCPTACTCPGCPTCDETCENTCNATFLCGTCADTCAATCDASCAYTCGSACILSAKNTNCFEVCYA